MPDRCVKPLEAERARPWTDKSAERGLARIRLLQQRRSRHALARRRL